MERGKERRWTEREKKKTNVEEKGKKEQEERRGERRKGEKGGRETEGRTWKDKGGMKRRKRKTREEKKIIAHTKTLLPADPSDDVRCQDPSPEGVLLRPYGLSKAVPASAKEVASGQTSLLSPMT